MNETKERMLTILIRLENHNAVWVERAEALDEYMSDDDMEEWIKDLLKIAREYDINVNGELFIYGEGKIDKEELMFKLENKIKNELKLRLCD